MVGRIQSLTESLNDLETRDRDAEYKTRFKNYTDAHRKATRSDISVGEFALTKNEQRG